jgi:O-Antigen ligase
MESPLRTSDAATGRLETRRPGIASPPELAERVGLFLAGSALPFALVLYLALKGGGYDAIVRSEVGIAVWWLVLLGAVVGILPVAGIRTAGWVALGLLAAFAGWTALGITWSESAERSVGELARVLTYLGVLAFALLVQGRDGLRRTVNALALAIGLVALLALLSRLHPAWFPDSDTLQFLPEQAGRLNYPLNYWNGLAALIGMGIPLVLVVAATSRRLLTQALATAALPAVALAAFLTYSRGGAAAIVAGLVVFIAIYPRRLELLPTVSLSAIGGALLIAAATQRDALEDGPVGAAAHSQGDEMLAMVVVVCAGVALMRVAVGLAVRHGIGPRLGRPSARQTGWAVLGVVAAALVVAVAVGMPSELSDRWDEFKQPDTPAGSAERFESSSGSGRYQWWGTALDAFREEPATGIGPGTYEFFWAREGTIPGFVRDAHSLYLETLGELGPLGLLLIAGLVLGVVGAGIALATRADPGRRAVLAGATAACTVFAVAAAVDWVWELAVLPVVFVLLAGAILNSAASEGHRGSGRGIPLLVLRGGLAVLAVASLVAIAIPLASGQAVRSSQQEARAAQLDAALDAARSAKRIEPYAATPSLQEALVLERRGDLDGAVVAARAAAEDEPTNWKPWFVLSRVQIERGRPEEGLRAYREARSLNPRSQLFQ